MSKRIKMSAGHPTIQRESVFPNVFPHVFSVWLPPIVERSLEFLNPPPRRRGALHLFNDHSHSRLRMALPFLPAFPFHTFAPPYLTNCYLPSDLALPVKTWPSHPMTSLLVILSTGAHYGDTVVRFRSSVVINRILTWPF